MSSSSDDRPNEVRVSHLAARDRWVLFGEPGSGKSTVFEQAAEVAGTEIVTARAFVEGRRPPCSVVFIDALEEYRISEPGRNRLVDLATALKSAHYTQWRIACRAISLPQADLLYLARELGGFETWQLDLLERREQEDILRSIGEKDPSRFIRQINDMAAGPLLGNPATLKLLHASALASTIPLHTRGALLAEATRQMAQEVNAELPERRDQPTPGAIITAAEKACLVLVLSARTDIWVDRSSPPGKHVVTKDDLLPSQIDTEALRHALDTPMFRGEAGSFVPTHRMVAEYLAGRALAAAVNSVDGKPAALPLDRALALLSGDDGKPAPALVGTFAWFVSSLANGIHRNRALELVRQAPEAILLQGDAAMLPTEHRLALLEATGRKDPWFLSGMRGSTAIGGLAGDDLVPQFQAILDDANESSHRRAMVLEALAVGRPITAMLPALQAFALDSANPFWLRREAMTAIAAIHDDPQRAVRSIFNVLKEMADNGSVVLRVTSLPTLVGVDATADEVRNALSDYAAARDPDDVTGYAFSLKVALECHPLPGLFDEPMHLQANSTRSRSFEVKDLVQRALAAAIEASPNLAAADLLKWIGNAGLKRYAHPEGKVHAAIAGWLDVHPSRPADLFWALHRQAHKQAWHAGYEYHRVTGRAAPLSVRVEALNQLEAIKAGEPDTEAVDLAYHLMAPIGDQPDLYWRLWHLLERRSGAETLFESLTRLPVDDWRTREKREEREQSGKRAQAVKGDREWILTNEAAVRSGGATLLLAAAAEMYAGHWSHLTDGDAFDRVLNWAGADLADLILAGWASVVQSFPITCANQATFEVKNQSDREKFIVVAWVDYQLRQGVEDITLPLEAAFAALRGSFILDDQARRRAVEAFAVEAIGKDPTGSNALVDFWKVTTSPKEVSNIPYAHSFEGQQVAAAAVEALLIAKPSPNPLILRSALALAARCLPMHRLRPVIQHALASTLGVEARIIWAFVAFLIDPGTNEDAFEKELASTGAHALFDALNHEHLLGAFDALTEAKVTRDTAIVRNLGPIYRPTESLSSGLRDTMSQAVAAAIKNLASSPTAEGTAALEELEALDTLALWRDTLRHHLEAQRRLRQQAEFRPPEPIDIARAVNAGPPATPADLRAVVREILADLANDIRNGDTSAWRSFWNNPGDEKRTPKEENDCRDLLTDRIRDRLIRFGVGAKRAFTEARSVDDRRADLLLIGERDAALPLEAKRHTNREIWSAPTRQLDPYARSAGSSGHGVYLIFWFGTAAGSVLLNWKGAAKIETPDALQAAIIDTLNKDQRAKLDVIVLDVSPAPPKNPAKAVKPKSSAKPKATKPERATRTKTATTPKKVFATSKTAAAREEKNAGKSPAELPPKPQSRRTGPPLTG